MASSVPIALVEAARTGESAALDRLVESAWPDAYRLALFVLGDTASAQDAAQDACIALCRMLPSLRATAAFGAWFYRIVIRAASAIARGNARSTRTIDPPAEFRDHAVSMDILRALEALPQNLRDVVVLHYFEDLTSREVASILRVPDATVRFRLMTARRKLRPLLGYDVETRTQPTGEVRTHAI
jgi:RNA polymerase sigma-70 factor (ECF subfamily)